MSRRVARPTFDELVTLVGELRDRIAVLEAENARLRAEVAAVRGPDGPPPTGTAPVPVASAPPAAGKRPLGIKANVVMVARRCRRATRVPVPGRRREVPDRIVVHAPTICPCCGDELRRGRNGSIWTMSTPTVRLFPYVQSRAGAVAERLLGEGGTGTVVSDFYGAYDRLDRPHQRCWAHLLRDLHALCDDDPADHRLQRWAAAVGKLYAKAVAWAAQATGERPILRERVADRFARSLVAICRSQLPGSPQAVLCQRIDRYQTELFGFVADPAVPAINNAAERSLRPLVIARKISGGTRSKQGSQTRMILQSLVATWDLRGLDPIAEFVSLLRTPAHSAPEIAPV